MKEEDDDDDDELDLVEIPGKGDFDLEVVGESHYQQNLWTIAGPTVNGKINVDTEARLIMEDDNIKDKNAVRIEIMGKQVGYLSREIAPLYRQILIDRKHPKGIGIAKAQIRAYNNNYGVRLDIPVEVVEESKTQNNKKGCLSLLFPP